MHPSDLNLHETPSGSSGSAPVLPSGAVNLTADQLDTLRHMLGINTPGDREPKPYRDYYCANRGDEKLIALAAAGAVRLYRKSDTYDWYCCTNAGRAAAMASHKTIRLSKSKRVYLCWLHIRDCQPDLTFKTFLTHPDYAKTRVNALTLEPI